MGIDPLLVGAPEAARDPYDSDQAIPTLLVGRERRRLEQLVPSLQVEKTHWFSFAAYPLSGGFKPWALLSDRMGARLLSLEKKLEPALGRLFGFRMLSVFEKKQHNSGLNSSVTA
jgi:hypothetical protein